MVNWEIAAIDCYPARDELDMVAFEIHWRASSDQFPQASCYGSVRLQSPDPAQFIPFSQLTRDQVLNWTFEVLGDTVQAVESTIADRVSALTNPPVTTPPLPWE